METEWGEGSDEGMSRINCSCLARSTFTGLKNFLLNMTPIFLKLLTASVMLPNRVYFCLAEEEDIKEVIGLTIGNGQTDGEDNIPPPRPDEVDNLMLALSSSSSSSESSPSPFTLPLNVDFNIVENSK